MLSHRYAYGANLYPWSHKIIFGKLKHFEKKAISHIEGFKKC